MKQKRFLSLFTAFAMCICLLSGYTSAALAANAGDFTVTTTSSGYSYDSENHILTISGGGEYEISGTTTTDRIIIESEDDVTLTLNNVNIASSVDSPLRADKGNLTLILKGNNSLTSTAENYPGLTKESSDYTLIITSCKGDGYSEGSLTSNGAYQASGIGGGAFCNGSNITIAGGTITATAGSTGAGIGGGFLGGGSNIIITGGVVTATGYKGAGIGGGVSGDGSVTITGGMISATGGGEAIGGGDQSMGTNTVTITGGYFADDDFTTGVGSEGKVYDRAVADGYGAYANADETTSDAYPCIVVSTTDAFIITGDFGYAYEDNILEIKEGGEYVVTMNTYAEITATNTDRIVVNSEDDVTLTIKDVNITATYYDLNNSPLRADKGNLTLILEGDNYLMSTADFYPGLTKETEDYTLTITSYKGDGYSEGSLTTSGGYYAAGIGGGYKCNGNNIIISGGTITATSVSSGAGIGGGESGTGIVSITGGTVNATGNGGGAGIGGGAYGNGNIMIIGGMISAEGKGTYSGQAIGNGVYGSGSIVTIIGGFFADSDFTAGENGTVYDYNVLNGFAVHANTDATTSGTYPCFVSHIHETYDENGFCIVCGGYQPATLNDEGVYEISNAGQLFWFASLVSGDVIQDGITAADTAANAILTTDIDLNGKEWTPIGTKAAPYTGTFDGNGYEISGLSITTEAEYIGLFGYVKEGTVENLTVSGAIDVSGDTIFAGGIVGTIYNGTLSNLTSYVDVTGETATKGTFGGVAATVEGTDKTAGSTMENCANYGDVTPSGVLDCTGGLVGYMNSATINNCANYGKVDTIGATAQQNEGVYAAGIVSYINNATAVIANCINVGTISGAAESEDYDRYTGAIVGRVKNNVGEITNVYYLDTSADESCASNGSGIELDITAKTADELASGAVTYLLQNGASDSVWGQDLENDAYPTLYKTNVVKLTFVGDSTVERYANVGIVPTNYPTPATGIYAFYTDSDMTNRIDTGSYTYTADATVYMAQMYTVTQNLTNITSDNTATEAVPGSEFIANLTAADGYVIKSVTVTMGSSDITNTAYSNGTVNISSVSGDIVVTAIVVAVAKTFTVAQNLTNVTSDNTSTETVEGSTYTANLTAADGYIIESVTITMDNLDITNTAYSNGVVNISNVNGDIVITATAAAVVEKTIKINSVTVNNNSVDVDITNTLEKNGVVIVAMYDISGTLLDFATTELADGIVNVDIDTTDAATVSVFIWDSVSSMIPLCGRYTQNMVDINGVTINNNSIDVDITNTLEKSGVVIVAVYDADGALVDLATEDLADGTVSVSVDTANAATASAYIWDGASTMIPLCDKYTVTN